MHPLPCARKLGDDAVHCDAGEDVNHAVHSLDVGQAKMADALNVVSQSYDDSEGGMDGLVQALICEVSQDKCLNICFTLYQCMEQIDSFSIQDIRYSFG